MSIRRFLILVLLLMGAVTPAIGQDIIGMYRQVQAEEEAQRLLRNMGSGAQPLPPALLPIQNETVRQNLTTAYPEPVVVLEPAPPAFTVTDWQYIRRIERRRFTNRYGRIRWSFSGPRKTLSVDTAFTRVLRARLETRFGQPTQTLVELDVDSIRRPADYIEFEYWLIANDTIPVRVYDPSGPNDRGLVVATDQRFRDLLPALREQINAEIGPRVRPGRFVDYYYEPETRDWFLTGYNGRRYFNQPIRKPNLNLGRPRLDSSNTP